MNLHLTTIARSHKPRRGSVYIAVLGVAMIVSIVSLSAMQITRLQRKSALALDDMAEARLMAQSAVEYALAQITADPVWRKTFASGVEYPADWVSLGGSGEFKFDLTDSDGSLSDDVNDAVTLRGIGQSGEAVHVATVMLEPTGDPLACLEVSLCVNERVRPEPGGDMVTDQVISSNDDIDADDAPITGDVEAVDDIRGDITGRETSAIPLREMPHEHVFDYYQFNGTWIDVDALPVDGSNNPVISLVLLTPNVNPFGATNPAGIYVIDCQGKDLRIEDCRIVGTIVLLNPGNSTALASSVVLEPAVANLPSLMVQGDISISTNDVNLSELDTGVNFNPVGTPYRNIDDSDRSDTYASVVRGLVYVSGTLKLLPDPDSPHSRFRGVVVCERIHAASRVTFKYDSVFFSYPPPGFAQGPEWRVMPASWQRASN